MYNLKKKTLQVYIFNIMNKMPIQTKRSAKKKPQTVPFLKYPR